MVWGIFTFFLSVSTGAASCPSDISNSQHIKLYECTVEGTLTKESVFRPIKDEFSLFEINLFEKGTKRIQSRQIFQAKHGQPATYEFHYRSERAWDRYIEKIEIYDPGGNLQRAYKVNALETLSSQSNFNFSPPKVLIIDTGFEWTHPELISKHHFNSKEILNGVDDDRDGWVDNITTIKGIAGAGGSVEYIFNENEQLQIKDTGEPVSHGTFVASVAMKDIQHTSFLGASGALDSPVFIFKMLDIVRSKGIRFTNMSFGFGDKKGASFIDPESHEAISAFLTSSKNTLHTVAAGNHGIDFNSSDFSEYPACFRSKNIVTVGSIAASVIAPHKLSDYKRSQMSSYGTRCVDILAPGENMKGAGIFPYTIQASGTSVASPYALNIFVKMNALAPDFDPVTYRQLLLKTVFVPASGPHPVRSGGIIFPQRALLATRLHAQGVPLIDAIQQARRAITAPNEEENWATLQNLWQTNRL